MFQPSKETFVPNPMQKDKGLGTNDCNKKRKDFIEADGLRDTPLNCTRSLPTMNRLSAL